MSIEILREYFNITPDTSFLDGKYLRYVKEEKIYTLVPVTNMKEEVLVELYLMSDHLASQGDRNVSVFYAAKDQKFLVTHQEEDYVLLLNSYTKVPAKRSFGRKLAKFHQRGRSIQVEIQHTSSLGKWKVYWEKRLEQIEKVWYQVVQENPNNDFDHMFVETYPYYMGLCENAIQYIVDTELDEEPLDIDVGTVCHERFNNDIWGNRMWIRNPFDWVFDHASRDIAEWIRQQYFRKNKSFLPDVQNFLDEYQGVTSLSSFSWRLIYARLLFPLHYVECIEQYYLTNSEKQHKQLEERLHKHIRDSAEYESFLGNFFQLLGRNPVKWNIPEIGWFNVLG
ncbi:spore coat putative kinase YutH [Bacillus sp. FJAT-49736]|uniref:spore coat putative kinase YutH n=1 Tax=Bacillus sp. FJAT-49736 TaxID=2833582 RepID=UPI001BC8ECDA|nr:spore coat protein YutH [Bacillus sp. FJAT-49736]MBS4173943.1 spore coat protein YutH [Bacillus sp. FJAT-49736]